MSRNVAEPMRVAINAWFWDQPATGSGQYLRHLLPAFPDLAPGFAFKPCVPPTPGRDGRLSDVNKLLFEQVTFPRTAAAWRADVAHVPYFASPLRPTTATVVTVHDLIPLVLPDYRGSVLVRAYSRLVAAGARRADAIIADSEWSKRDILAHLEVEERRVHVIPLAAGPNFRPATRAEVEEVRRRYALPERYVLYLGGFERRKNVPTLLQAFAQLRAGDGPGDDVALVLAGRPPARDTGFTPHPARIAARLGIEAAVVLPGWIDEADKPALYSGAEAFVFPSSYEGFGLPVLEAMACGAPVVTSNASSLPEVAGDAGILVEADDPSGFAAALRTLLTDVERRQALRQASLAHAGRFSWERTAAATLDVYRQVLAAG